MATWNTDNPKTTNQITADIADIEENFQELHDVIHAITDGTLGTTTAANFRVDAISAPVIWLNQRAQFVYKDADEIYLNAGAYHHVGTTTQVVYWNSQLTLDIGAPSASTWYYVYLDDSAIVSAGTNLLTATEFLFSTTEPAWSDAKHGWYNGLDRCIFAVRTDGSSNIIEFFHDGGDHVFKANYTEDYSATDVDTTWTDVTLVIPKFSTKADVTFYNTLANSGGLFMFWRTNGQSGTSGHPVVVHSSDFAHATANVKVLTDSSQIIEVKNAGASNNKIEVYTHGWYFPTGM